MNSINLTGFDYPPRGFVYPASACNSTWIDILQAKPLDLSYPPDDPLQANILFVAGMICRSSDNAKISDLAWHVFTTLTAFGYRPSLGFGIFALVAFSLSVTWHGWQLLRTRAWVMIPALVGGGLEIYGWTNRELANSDPRFYYVEQLATLTIAPTFFSCTIYSLFQIVVNFIDVDAAVGSSPRKMMWIWIVIDFVTLVIQATGGGLAATSGTNNDIFETGSHIMLAGIILQLVVAVTFSGIAFVYFKRVYRSHAGGFRRSEATVSLGTSEPMSRFVLGLAIAQFCIILRGFYRVAELAGGLYSHIARDQAATIALDGLPMIITIFMLNLIHPQFTLPSKLWRRRSKMVASGDGIESSSVDLDRKV